MVIWEYITDHQTNPRKKKQKSKSLQHVRQYYLLGNLETNIYPEIFVHVNRNVSLKVPGALFNRYNQTYFFKEFRLIIWIKFFGSLTRFSSTYHCPQYHLIIEMAQSHEIVCLWFFIKKKKHLNQALTIFFNHLSKKTESK